MKKFVLLISGTSCTGKSSLVKVISQKFPGVYNVAHDKLKWQLAGYDRRQNGEVMKKLVEGFFRVVCEQGLSILLEVIIRSPEALKRYEQTAAEFGYQFISVKLTAPEDVLLKRWRERVKDAKANNRPTSMTKEEDFIENVRMAFYVPSEATVFDTSVVSTDEIAEKISELITAAN